MTKDKKKKKKMLLIPKWKVFRAKEPLISVFMWGVNHIVSSKFIILGTAQQWSAGVWKTKLHVYLLLLLHY